MKLLMVSLGCDKNRVDSERMLGILAAHGYTLTDDEEEAEVAVLNTCCFIEEAKKESIDNIFELARLKEEAKLRVLIVTGCMAQRYKDEILDEIPEIDAIVGTTGIDSIARAVDDALQGRRDSLMGEDISTDPDLGDMKRVITTGGHYAYLKIAEGCDKRCTYCAIPDIRGHYRSYPMEKLVREAQELADQGVQELILVAEETTLYGRDLYKRKCLPELLRKLCRIEGIHWIRILYCYPEEIDDELIETIAAEPKICHYLDLPIQHASDSILKAMHRRTTRADLEVLIDTLRKRIPDIVLRTTLITGFPGETEEDHEILKDFVRKEKFDRLGVFTYSKEEGTPAAAMKNQVPRKIRNRRYNELMAMQQRISRENGRSRIGSVMEAVVEGELTEDGVYVARTYGDAPNVDGLIFFPRERELLSGDFVSLEITDASEYDLYGKEYMQ